MNPRCDCISCKYEKQKSTEDPCYRCYNNSEYVYDDKEYSNYPQSKGKVIQLKPCPFCGGKAHIRTERYYQPNMRRNVICEKCYSNSGWYKTEEEAAKAWNRRTK